MANRRICTANGHVYNLVSNPPATDGICDLDGAELVQRGDDEEATVRARMAQQVPPLLEVGSKNGSALGDPLEDRPRKLDPRSGTEKGVRTGAGGRHHRRTTVLEQEDRRTFEGNEPLQLGDEGAERLVELEGGAERPSAAACRFEHVDVPTELVPEALGLLGTIPCER